MCDAAKSFRGDLRARLFLNEVIPNCYLENSYIDVALMSNKLTPKSRVNLLGMFELKNTFRDGEFVEVVYQTVCYMVSALAYSRWGVLQDKSPLVALLVASDCVYRLTLTRATTRAMGFMIAIDKAKDVVAMEWVLAEYMRSYISDYRKLSSIAADSTNKIVDPFDWAPLNFGNSQLWSPLCEEHNFGFIFRTTSDEVIRVTEDFGLEWVVGEVSPGANVVVKHVNAILDIDFESGVESIKSILSKFVTAAKDAEIAYLRAQLEVRNSPPPKSQTDFSATFTPAMEKNILGIKHPYLAIVQGLVGPLIVMEDVGAPLSEVMESPHFRQRWAQSADLRRAFFSDVGLSALNLVDKVGLCHNDIRPPNIAFCDDTFCLVDFEFARKRIRCNDLSAFSPWLMALAVLDRKPQLMCFSVAQIVLTVFMLSGPKATDYGAVTDAISIWKRERGTSKVDSDFESWVQGKGGLLLDFVSACRGARPWSASMYTDYKRYLSDVLLEMLK